MFTDDEFARLATAVAERVPHGPDLWRDAAGRAFDIRDACSFVTVKRGLEGRLVDGSTVLIEGQELGRLEKHLRARSAPFQRTHNGALVNIARVRSVQRVDDVWAVHFDAPVPPAPVSLTYAEATAEALGAGHTLDQLTPLSPYAAAIEELELINLGEEEAQAIDPGDAAAAEAWRDKWWIENFDAATMKRYFRQKTQDKLNKTKIIRNAIWQRYLSVKWGLWWPEYGDTRGLYYQPVEDILARHNLMTQGDHKLDADTVASHLRDMVVQYRLLSYQDFDFPPPNPTMRHVGESHPHLIVFSEKQDFIKILQRFATPYGASYYAARGEPSTHAMEVFARLLKAAFDPERQTVHIFGVTDLNPGGTSIGQSVVEDLQAFGFPRVRYHSLVDLSLYEPYQIKYFRKQLIKFRVDKDGTIDADVEDKPYITKAQAWFKKVLGSDSRFRSEVALPDGKFTQVTLYGLQSNTIKTDRLRRRFEETIAKYVAPPPAAPPDPVATTALRASVSPRWAARARRSCPTRGG